MDKFEIKLAYKKNYISGLINYTRQPRVEDAFNWSTTFIPPGLCKYKYKNGGNKHINDVCCISLEIIQPGSNYLLCNTCNKNFSEKEIKKWLNTNKSCPACRSDWNNFDVYINVE